MNTTPPDVVILKTDALGRVKTPAGRREQLLDEFERSGMSGAQFAEFVGIKYPTNYSAVGASELTNGLNPSKPAIAGW